MTPEPNNLPPLRIVLVEDQVLLAMALTDALTALGHEVVSQACTASGAVLVTGQFRPDIVITDIHLGSGGEGIEAAREIQTRFGINVIIVTGDDDADVRQRAYDVGYFAILAKPYPLEDLEAVLARASANLARKAGLRYRRQRRRKRSRTPASEKSCR